MDLALDNNAEDDEEEKESPLKLKLQRTKELVKKKVLSKLIKSKGVIQDDTLGDPQPIQLHPQCADYWRNSFTHVVITSH